ncbi:MAG: Glucose-6-phosphate 1-dehydrogenase [Pseudonocardiales bacterium]|nr:Glucose-6-phosphate 1-dehydrogenase [Pseudonocardiales bacterium]
MIETLVVFGAGGDLAGRLLLPAVASLFENGYLNPGFVFIGAGADNFTAVEFTDHVRRRLSEHAQHVDPAARDALGEALQYCRADVSVDADVGGVLDLARTASGSGPVAVYLALPTQLMLVAVQNLMVHGLPAGSRVVVEKPFGYDAASAADLNSALTSLNGLTGPGDVYRVDHFLAMPALQQLHEYCFPGTGRPISWTGSHIEKVELLFEETLALEGRASFYDRAGALRDVMQNHLVQVLCTIAASDPRAAVGPSMSSAERRADVLRTVRPLSPAEIVASTRRARYVAGRLADVNGGNGRAVPDYAAEDGVDQDRNTETFAEVVLQLDSPTWTGTRFVLRAGKALAARRRGVLIHFRSDTNDDAVAPDPVWLDLDEPPTSGTVGAEPFAYQRIIADVLSGKTTFAVSAEETELAWQVFTPVLQAWAAGMVPLTTYPAGTQGPDSYATPGKPTRSSSGRSSARPRRRPPSSPA